jgi:hypothetical protein
MRHHVFSSFHKKKKFSFNNEKCSLESTVLIIVTNFRYKFTNLSFLINDIKPSEQLFVKECRIQ